MGDQNEFFSVYGEGRQYANERQEGLKLFRASVKLTKASWSIVGIVLASSLTFIALWVVPRAHAGAQFIVQRLVH
jgi:heme/copper-type cytochrome/quinol oxidase subunit 4